MQVRDRRYLNNVVEQDHRAIKMRCACMLGFKSSESAAVTIAGIELAHRVRKRQFQFGSGRTEECAAVLSLRDQGERALAPASARDEAELTGRPLLHQISAGAIKRTAGAPPEAPRRYPRKVYIGHGLYMLHHPNGGRYWRYKYRIQGRGRILALGVYPVVSVEMARARHLAARRFLESGMDPSQMKREVRGESGFANTAFGWRG